MIYGTVVGLTATSTVAGSTWLDQSPKVAHCCSSHRHTCAQKDMLLENKLLSSFQIQLHPGEKCLALNLPEMVARGGNRIDITIMNEP